jgi:hypothetical protein
MAPRPPRTRKPQPDLLPDSLPRNPEPDVLPDSLGEAPTDTSIPDSLPPRNDDAEDGLR